MYGPQLAACGRDARAPRRCRGDGVYRCMRARCLCTRHAGATPAHPGGAGVMGCIAVYGRDARAPRRCRGDGVYAVCGRNACAPGMRAQCLYTRHAGWKPAHPGGAGVMECIAACGRDARAPRRCRGDGVYRCMRAQCLCTRHAGETPAHPGGAGVMGCIAVCGRNACAPGMRARRLRPQAVMFSGAIGSDCGGSGETLVFSEEM